MAHKWNTPVKKNEAHAVTCQLCGVFVERVFEGERGVNFNTVLAGERVRGLAPKCTGKQSDVALAADTAPVVEDAKVETAPEEAPKADITTVLVESCEKYETMSTKELYRLAAGRVKNYKKMRKAELVFALAAADEVAARHEI
jgi:hypothetical protein